MTSLNLYQLTIAGICVVLRFICPSIVSSGKLSPKVETSLRDQDEYQNGFLFLDVSSCKESQHVSALHMSYAPQGPDVIQSFAQEITSRDWTGIALRYDGHTTTTLLAIGKLNPLDELFERYGIIMVRSSWYEAQPMAKEVFRLH